MQSVEDLVVFLSRHPELAEIPRAADRDDHAVRRSTSPPARSDRRARRRRRPTRSARASLGEMPRPRVVSRSSSTSASLTDERSVNCSVARRRHVPRVREDRLALREVDDGREGLGSLEHLEAEAVAPRLECGRHPETPAPTITRSSVPASVTRLRKAGSPMIVCIARAPPSDANLSSGTPVRSPTTYRPGTAVEPSGWTSGSFSTVPAGHRRCSQSRYRATGFAEGNELLSSAAAPGCRLKNAPGAGTRDVSPCYQCSRGVESPRHRVTPERSSQSPRRLLGGAVMACLLAALTHPPARTSGR